MKITFLILKRQHSHIRTHKYMRFILPLIKLCQFYQPIPTPGWWAFLLKRFGPENNRWGWSVRAVLEPLPSNSSLKLLNWNVSSCSVPGTESSQPYLDVSPLSGGTIAVLKGASFHCMFQMWVRAEDFTREQTFELMSLANITSADLWRGNIPPQRRIQQK